MLAGDGVAFRYRVGNCRGKAGWARQSGVCRDGGSSDGWEGGIAKAGADAFGRAGVLMGGEIRICAGGLGRFPLRGIATVCAPPPGCQYAAVPFAGSCGPGGVNMEAQYCGTVL